MKAYQIIDWHQRHENKDTKKLRRGLRYLPETDLEALPIWNRLMRLPGAMNALGVYRCMCHASRRRDRDRRGWIVDAFDRPLSLQDMADLYQAPVEDWQRAAEALMEAGWIREAELPCWSEPGPESEGTLFQNDTKLSTLPGDSGRSREIPGDLPLEEVGEVVGEEKPVTGTGSGSLGAQGAGTGTGAPRPKLLLRIEDPQDDPVNHGHAAALPEEADSRQFHAFLESFGRIDAEARRRGNPHYFSERACEYVFDQAKVAGPVRASQKPAAINNFWQALRAPNGLVLSAQVACLLMDKLQSAQRGGCRDPWATWQSRVNELLSRAQARQAPPGPGPPRATAGA